MKPIAISVAGFTQKSSQEICAEFLDTKRWSEFKGYAFLPGIEAARFETKTSELIGSRIKVKNMDGSSHIEEIIEWDERNQIAVKFQDFDSPLRNLATYFIEVWAFRETAGGTEITRSMTMYPKGIAGWLMLNPISRLMKKAFEKHLRQTSADRPAPP